MQGGIMFAGFIDIFNMPFLFQKGGGIAEEFPPRLGKFHPPVGAVEKADAQLGLQLLDGAADTGLGEKQVLGGLVDRAAAGDLYHIEKLLKRHGRHLHNTVFCIPLL